MLGAVAPITRTPPLVPRQWRTSQPQSRLSLVVVPIAIFLVRCNTPTPAPEPPTPPQSAVTRPVTTATPTDPDPSGASFDVDAAKAAVFRVEGPNGGMGSGFLVSDAGHAVTLSSLAGGRKEISVELQGGRQANAKVLNEDPASGLAALFIKDARAGGLRLVDAGRLSIASEVVALGYPMGMQTPVTTKGIVSSLPAIFDGLRLALIQVDAAVQPGAAGGPLLDAEGQVVGILAGRLPGVEAMNYALPANYAAHLDRLPSGVRYLILTAGAEQSPFLEWNERAQGIYSTQEGKYVLAEGESLDNDVVARMDIPGIAPVPEGVVVFLSFRNRRGNPVTPRLVNFTALLSWDPFVHEVGKSYQCENGGDIGEEDYDALLRLVAEELGLEIPGSVTAFFIPCPDIVSEPSPSLQVTVRCTRMCQAPEVTFESEGWPTLLSLQ